MCAVDLVANMERVDLRALNLTFQVRLEDEASLAQMGLLIAARSLDRLDLAREPGGALRFSLVKEKAYPLSSKGKTPAPRELASHVIRAPQPAELKWVSRLVTQVYPAHLVPPELIQPAPFGGHGGGRGFARPGGGGPGRLFGRVRDLDRPGRDHRALPGSLSSGPAQRIAHGRPPGGRHVARVGPHQGGDLAQHAAHVRSCPPNISNHWAVICSILPKARPREITVQFRGRGRRSRGHGLGPLPRWSNSWTTNTNACFWPDRCCPPAPEGENRPPHSVLATRWQPSQGQAFLRPLEGGRDAAENLSDHVKLLRDQMLPTLFF